MSWRPAWPTLSQNNNHHKKERRRRKTEKKDTEREWDSTTHQPEWLKFEIKRTDNIKDWQRYVTPGTSIAICKTVNWDNHLGKLAVFTRAKHKYPSWVSNSPQIYNQEKLSVKSTKKMWKRMSRTVLLSIAKSWRQTICPLLLMCLLGFRKRYSKMCLPFGLHSENPWGAVHAGKAFSGVSLSTGKIPSGRIL
jgi:hypothetical protein